MWGARGQEVIAPLYHLLTSAGVKTVAKAPDLAFERGAAPGLRRGNALAFLAAQAASGRVVVHCSSDMSKSRRWAGPFDCASCYVLLLLRRLVLIGLPVLLLVLLTRLMILLGSLAGLRRIRGLVWLGGSNVDGGHRIIFRISTQKYFRAGL